jgi:diguanylate cyclase
MVGVRGWRRVSPAGFALAIATSWAVLLALTVVRAGAGGSRLEHLALCAVTALGASSCLVRAGCRREDRFGWAMLGAGLSGYAAGFACIFVLKTGAGPLGLNLSDWVSLPLYPLAFVGLVALRSRPARQGPSSVEEGLSIADGLDGLVVALAAGAVLVTLVGRRHQALFHGSHLKLVYALAYPVGSLTLFAGALTILALRHWRLEARWLLLLAGFAALAVGDVIYAFRAANGAFRFGTWLDATYAAGPALVGLAAWPDARREVRPPRTSSIILAIPGLATLASLGVLLSDHISRTPGLAVLLAGAGITVSLGRTVLFVRQQVRYERARQESLTDDLTGLANRRALERALARSLGRGDCVSLVLVDLDGFKEINDTLGHAAGDVLLRVIAERLRATASDVLVARIGGDEFGVVLDGDAGAAAACAAAICHAVDRPMTLAGAVVAVTASAGHATAGDGPGELADHLLLSPGELLRRADVAMYHAKHLRTRSEPWVPALDVGTRERLEVVAALRHAVTDPRQIVVHYQPQFDSRSLRLVGVEALVRWEHPTRGLLAPGGFLPAAEDAGLLTAITSCVLGAALGEMGARGPRGNGTPVSVNVTAPDLLDVGFPDRVAAALSAHGVHPSLLRLEITETVVMSDPQRVLAALGRLKRLGVSLSLDDYGTGLSSLAYLQNLPVDELKIDRSFVSRILTDRASAVIVSSTIELAHALGLTVVAEGVEDTLTLDALASSGCDTIQGFLLGRPAPACELDRALDGPVWVTEDH